MGANRPTVANKARKKRRKKFEKRLAEKALAAQQPEGLVAKAKHAASSAAHTVSDAASTAAHTVSDAVMLAAHAVKDAVTPASK